ncbi:MAG: DUF1570 domain-containing protein, partial [Planctomycetota bacterium]
MLTRIITATALAAALLAPGVTRAAEVESEHYVVWTELDEAFAKQVSERMEAMFNAYGQVVGEISGEVKFKVRIYRTKAAYANYITKTHKIKGDRFRYVHYKNGSNKNEVLGWRVPDEALYPRLRHEAFHQYFRHMINKPPQWLNEGLAEMLEASDIGPEGEIDVRVSALHRRLREGIFKVEEGPLNSSGYVNIPTLRLVKMTKKQWLAKEREAYALSWGLIYYMLLEGDQRWVDPLVNYINALEPSATEQENLDAAYRAAFGVGHDAKGLGNEFGKWVAANPAPGYEEFKAGDK